MFAHGVISSLIINEANPAPFRSAYIVFLLYNIVETNTANRLCGHNESLPLIFGIFIFLAVQAIEVVTGRFLTLGGGAMVIVNPLQLVLQVYIVPTHVL